MVAVPRSVVTFGIVLQLIACEDAANSVQDSCADKPENLQHGSCMIQKQALTNRNLPPADDVENADSTESDTRLGPWKQCGGKDWGGPTTCVAGYKCKSDNEWWASCQPDEEESETDEGESENGKEFALRWQQCGGQDWAGPTSCESGFTCIEVNTYYFQCKHARTEDRATTAPPGEADEEGMDEEEASDDTPPDVDDLPVTSPTPEAPEPTPKPKPLPSPAVDAGDDWVQAPLVLTHYWDCSGQGCDAATLQPWNPEVYISPPGYMPQDPNDHGGPSEFGEKMWITGAASDSLADMLGANDGCCGKDNDSGGCGKCILVKNPDAVHADWSAIVMKKNRCPPWSNGCGKGSYHFDLAIPGFDNLQYSTANICGDKPGTGLTKAQSSVAGSWYQKHDDTRGAESLCDELPKAFQKGCKMFARWGWPKGVAEKAQFRVVSCPAGFVNHVGSMFGASGPME